MTNATDIAAYSFDAELLHPACLIENLIGAGIASPGARGMDVEAVLAQTVAAGEWSDTPGAPESYPAPADTFDSGSFPKAVFDTETLSWNETCGRCFDPIQ